MTKLNNLMNIESPVIVKVADLKQHPKNPRKQNQKAMEFLRKSIDTLGSFRPLLVNHKNEVLAGNQLLSVLQEKGIDEVVCIYPKKELTAMEEKHIIVADNQNSFHKSSNSWDIDIFANEFDFVLEDYNLDFSDIDFTLGVNFENTTQEGLSSQRDFTNKEIDIDNIDTSECKIIFKFDADDYEEKIQQINIIKQEKSLKTNEDVLTFLLSNYES